MRHIIQFLTGSIFLAACVNALPVPNMIEKRDRLLDYAKAHNIVVPTMGAAFEGCSNCSIE
ncbi:af650b6f-87f4-4641-9e3c-d1336217e146 [Sclerotinia trifoliorum]|uniref:Af650b6f-87f4-4641-9e3c-d1336217e146 n=1 Tax=Sclerotinia trifoliorum TaxID=28548 RepID=A0A8H2ZKV2_9HELO|nr:af650b6f-87f4-4641-9e3c-d1336217e146 [Sclerotinia trifoliorum]